MPATLRLTPELADSLALAVRNGVPIETAAQAAGIQKQTFYEWLQAAERQHWHDGTPVQPQALDAISAFSDKIRRAQAEHEADIVARVQQAAQSVNEKTGVPEWRAGAWLLNNHPRYRERYRQHRELEVHQSGTVQHEHQLARQLEQPALEQAYEALDALEPNS